jgi:hypothetical protein
MLKFDKFSLYLWFINLVFTFKFLLIDFRMIYSLKITQVYMIKREKDNCLKNNNKKDYKVKILIYLVSLIIYYI